VAEKADVIIAVVGGSSARDFDGTFNDCGQAVVELGNVRTDMECGEGYDHHSLELAGAQGNLLRELRNFGKPLVVILIHGRPYAIPWVAENADAILAAWYPGQEGGRALADILFGDANPCGKLAISFPKHAGQTPVYYNHKPVARMDYAFLDAQPQYAFGYGLSYTTFAFSNLLLSEDKIRAGEVCEASVTVTNTGTRVGKEVVQLYIRDEESTFTRPVIELKDFQKLRLAPGESTVVRFQIGPETLAYPGEDLSPWVEPGVFGVLLGDDPNNLLEARLDVVE